MDQAVPEIPLSVGSKLELLLSLPNFRILPRTLTYMTEAPRVLHFSAFINPRRACAARVTVVGSVCLRVCVSVCLSVCYLQSRFSNVYSSHKRYDLLNGR